VVEQQPSVNQIKLRARDRPLGGHVAGRELTLTMTVSAKHRDCRLTERHVDIDPLHRSRRTDTLRHQPHRFARTTARVQAALTRSEPDPVEQPARRRLPHPRLGTQTLVLLRRARQRIAGMYLLGRGNAHRDLLHASSGTPSTTTR